MFYLGLTLSATDFGQVLRRPRALIAGLVGQLLMVPLLGLALAYFMHLDPTMAVGLMVLVACPAGVSSGLLTRLAHGDVALSISLTAVTSVIAMLSLPLVVDIAMRIFMAKGLTVEFPLGSMVLKIFCLTTIPVLAGMALRAWKTQRIAQIEPIAGRVATGLFIVIVMSTFWDQRQVLISHLDSIGLACFLLNFLILSCAWLIGRRLHLTRRDRIAVATECGLQNSALGIYISLEVLHSPAMSVPSVVYALLMNLGAVAFVILMRTRSSKRDTSTLTTVA